jgi:hypothetical protein
MIKIYVPKKFHDQMEKIEEFMERVSFYDVNFGDTLYELVKDHDEDFFWIDDEKEGDEFFYLQVKLNNLNLRDLECQENDLSE